MRYESFANMAGQTVSATEFVRNFAQYKRIADTAPVHIEAHGKPGWALVSMALLDTLTRGGVIDRGMQSAAVNLDVILDSIPIRIMMLDEALNITRTNAAFRRHTRVSDEMAVGRSLAVVFSGLALEQARDAARRVIETSTTEVFEADSMHNRGRVLSITAARLPEGVAFMAEDITAPAELDAMRSDFAALRIAAGTVPGLCLGRINMRGSIDSADASLSALSGIANESLLGARLGTLFDMQSRVRINELIEQVLEGGQPGWTRAKLLSRGAEVMPVAVGLAAFRGRLAPSGAAFIIQDRTVTAEA